MSCLLANIRIAELRMNGSLMMLVNSSFARSMRSRIDESTTKIKPSVLLGMAPRGRSCLAAHVPHREHHVLVLHLLHVEACRGSAGTRVVVS